MIVAPVEDRAVRVIVNEVVRRAQTDAGHSDGRHVAFRPATLPLEVAVLDEMFARHERLAITTGQLHTAVSGVKDVAAHDPVIGPAFDYYAAVADVADEATFNAVVRAAADFDGVAAGGFQDKPAPA